MNKSDFASDSRGVIRQQGNVALGIVAGILALMAIGYFLVSRVNSNLDHKEKAAASVDSTNRIISDGKLCSTEFSSFSLNHLWVFNDAKTPLLERVGELLVASLRESKRFGRIDYFPLGEVPELGVLGPDIFISFGSEEGARRSTNSGRTVEARVFAYLGNSLAPSSYTINDYHTRSAVLHSRSWTIFHESSFVGPENIENDQQAMASSIVESLQGALNSHLDRLSENQWPAPSSSDAFYPQFRKSPSFPILKQLGFQQRWSGRAWMRANETVWSLGSIQSPKAILQQLIADYQSNGWHQQDGTMSPEGEAPLETLLFTRGVEQIFLSSQRQRWVEEANAEMPMYSLYVRYIYRMSVEEVARVQKTN